MYVSDQIDEKYLEIDVSLNGIKGNIIWYSLIKSYFTKNQ